MAQPKVEKLITAIDIGSWKVSALIAGRTDTGELAILGTGQRESRGVRRGFIADMERTELAVRETVEQAERVAGTNIEDVWVSFSGGSAVVSNEKARTGMSGISRAVTVSFDGASAFLDESTYSVTLTFTISAK